MPFKNMSVVIVAMLICHAQFVMYGVRLLTQKTTLNSKQPYVIHSMHTYYLFIFVVLIRPPHVVGDGLRFYPCYSFVSSFFVTCTWGSLNGTPPNLGT